MVVIPATMVERLGSLHRLLGLVVRGVVEVVVVVVASRHNALQFTEESKQTGRLGGCRRGPGNAPRAPSPHRRRPRRSLLLVVRGSYRRCHLRLREDVGWCPRSPRGVPLGSVVAVVLWAARFPLCPRDGPTGRCPSAFLGKIRILPRGVVAERLGVSRVSDVVLVARGHGYLKPCVSWVQVRLGKDTCPGGVLSGERAGEDGITRASTFGGVARTLGRPGPKSVSTRGRGLSHFLHGVVVFGRGGVD